ncbi:MAG: hypothetical protein IT306_24815 [Chloroflexi bacterium]|nr:hypothetical protein [Chloroflexota bacterium]
MPLHDPLGQYLLALFLTLLVEAPLVAWALARWYRVRPLAGVLLGLAGSLLTHPVVWFVLPAVTLPTLGVRGYLLTAEGFAWLAEAALYWLAVGWLAGRRDAAGLLLLSLLANLASFMLGAALSMAGYV